MRCALLCRDRDHLGRGILVNSVRCWRDDLRTIRLITLRVSQFDGSGQGTWSLDLSDVDLRLLIRTRFWLLDLLQGCDWLWHRERVLHGAWLTQGVAVEHEVWDTNQHGVRQIRAIRHSRTRGHLGAGPFHKA